MKNYFIFIVAGLLASNIEAKVIKVTSASTDETNKGSFLYCLKHANDGDEILFDLSEDTIRIANQCTFSAEKQLVINGKNVKTNKNIVFAPTNDYAKRGFEIPTEYPGGVMTAADITFRNCTFAKFKMTAIRNNGKLTLEECLFVQNGVGGITNGSALFVNTPCVIRNCVFDSNESIGESRGGAAIYAAKVGSRLDITNSSFINNYTSNQGAAMWLADSTVVKLTNCTFANNRAIKAENEEKYQDAGKGGAIISTITKVSTPAKYAPLIYAVNCTFTGNEANNGAGAIHLYPLKGTEKASVWLINTLLLYNYNKNEHSDIVEETDINDDRFYALNSIWGKGGRCDDRKEEGCLIYDYTTQLPVFQQMESTETNDRPHISNNHLPVVSLAEGSIVIGKAATTIPGNFIFTEDKLEIPSMDQLGHLRSTHPAIGAVEYSSATGVTKTFFNDIIMYQKDRKLMVSCPEGNFNLRIYTLSGQLCMNTNYSGTTTVCINLESYPKGLYTCELTQQANRKTTKFLLN